MVLMIKKRRRLKWKNIIAFSLIIIFLITLTISAIVIIKWKLDPNKSDKQFKEIQDFIEIEEVIEEDIIEEIKIIEQVEEIPQSNPYWDYIEINLINVKLNELKKTNSNTKGICQEKCVS